MATKSKLKTRKPTGLAPWPFIVVEGPEKTGKSYGAVKLSADPRIGEMWWLDCGEGAADQYAAIPGVEYEVIEHDGSYRSLLEQVRAFVDEVPGVVDGKPNVLVWDSASNLWSLLKADADLAARSSNYGQSILRRDGDAEVPISMDKWNTAKKKWKAIVDPLIQWPGLVIVTARGAETAKVGEDGKPVPNKKDYAIEAHKTLGFDADVIVRTTKPSEAKLMGARSVHIKPEDLDSPIRNYDKTGLAGLIFDVLKINPDAVGVRDFVAEKPEAVSGQQQAINKAKQELFAATGKDAELAKELWAAAGFDESAPIPAAGLKALLAKAADLVGGSPVKLDAKSRAGMFAQLGTAGVPESEQLAFISHAIGRDPGHRDHISQVELAMVQAALGDYVPSLDAADPWSEGLGAPVGEVA